MTSPLLEALTAELDRLLSIAWTRQGRGHRPRRYTARATYMREYSRKHSGYGLGRKGPSKRKRQLLASKAKGGNRSEVDRRFRLERSIHEGAIQEALRHLLGRIREAIGDTQPPPAIVATIRKAEWRQGHPERERQRVARIIETKRKRKVGRHLSEEKMKREEM